MLRTFLQFVALSCVWGEVEGIRAKQRPRAELTECGTQCDFKETADDIDLRLFHTLLEKYRFSLLPTQLTRYCSVNTDLYIEQDQYRTVFS